MAEEAFGIAVEPTVEGGNAQEEAPENRYQFFAPTAELAEALLEQNQRLVFVNMGEDVPHSSEPEVEPGVEGNLPLGMSEIAGSSSVFDRERQILASQRLIAQRLYHYLSSLAESPWARDRQGFPIAEYIPEGMETMLGLSVPPDSRRAEDISQLLAKLTDEFRDWLRQENGKFITPWIEIHMLDNDALLLITIEEEALPEPSPAEAEVGQTYVGEVTRIVDFGAFVEIFPGTDGLLHISEIADHRIRNVRDELREGQQIQVKVIGKTGNKIRVSRKAALQDSEVLSESEALRVEH